MKIRPIVGMRLEPDMLPSLIAAYDRAATDMSTMLTDLRSRGRLREFWAADDVSKAIFFHYNEEIMAGGPHSAYTALSDYQQELQKITDILKQMLVDYQHTENETTVHPKRLERPSA